jgi:hypothetical protein
MNPLMIRQKHVGEIVIIVVSYKKSCSWNGPLKSLIHADDDSCIVLVP